MTEKTRPTHERYVFVGTHGHVVAVDQETGATIWETSLPGTGYSVVAIVFESGRLLCASGGKVFALDPLDGSIRWENPLRGMGTGVTYLTTARSNDTESVMSLLEAQISADTASTTAATGAH
ncbi:MAG: hypothetical protein DHS20C15_34930 [Planctomycetota bacterium]|nr:MAG: hypothetical protein DHS20C15_34930 [Planctomycetota bacterium]